MEFAIIVFLFQSFAFITIVINWNEINLAIVLTFVAYLLNCIYGIIRIPFGDPSAEGHLACEIILIILSNHPYFVFNLKRHHHRNPGIEILGTLCQVWKSIVFCIRQISI